MCMHKSFFIFHTAPCVHRSWWRHQNLLDPKVRRLIRKQFSGESIVVFDEALNIDSVHIGALRVNIRQGTGQERWPRTCIERYQKSGTFHLIPAQINSTRPQENVGNMANQYQLVRLTGFAAADFIETRDGVESALCSASMRSGTDYGLAVLADTLQSRSEEQITTMGSRPHA